MKYQTALCITLDEVKSNSPFLRPSIMISWTLFFILWPTKEEQSLPRALGDGRACFLYPSFTFRQLISMLLSLEQILPEHPHISVFGCSCHFVLLTDSVTIMWANIHDCL